MEKKILTLCLLCDKDRVLLGMKKRGFGAGRWNGFGGKVEKKESIEDAARREMQEESGVVITTLQKRGVLEFSFEAAPKEILEVHIFHASDFTGKPKETEEMVPMWFTIDTIPFTKMWPDDSHWMPLFFAGKKFRGNFHFGKSDAILQSSLCEVASLEK